MKDYNDLENNIKKRFEEIRTLLKEKKNVNISTEEISSLINTAMGYGKTGLNFAQKKIDEVKDTCTAEVNEFLSTLSDEQILKLYEVSKTLNAAKGKVKKCTNDIKNFVKGTTDDVVIDLSTTLVANSIVNVKAKRFGEAYTNELEILTTKYLLEQKLKENGYNITFHGDIFLGFKTEKERRCLMYDFNLDKIKEEINDDKIYDIIFDENFIYNVLVEITLVKLNNSIIHNCDNCDLISSCHLTQDDNCAYFRHDFKKVELNDIEKDVIVKAYTKNVK